MPPKKGKKGKGGSKTKLKKGSKTKLNKKGKGDKEVSFKSDRSTETSDDRRDVCGWYMSWDRDRDGARGTTKDAWYKDDDWNPRAPPPLCGPDGCRGNWAGRGFPGPCARASGKFFEKDPKEQKGKKKEKTEAEEQKEAEERAKAKEEICLAWQHECNLMHDICTDPKRQCEFGVTDEKCEAVKKQCIDWRDACYGSGQQAAGANADGTNPMGGPTTSGTGPSAAPPPPSSGPSTQPTTTTTTNSNKAKAGPAPKKKKK